MHFQPKLPLDQAREGLIAARVMALAGLVIGCWLFLFSNFSLDDPAASLLDMANVLV